LHLGPLEEVMKSGLSIRKAALKSQEDVQRAQVMAQETGQQQPEPINLLVALLDTDQAVIRALLS
jgi:hypothetical protein